MLLSRGTHFSPRPKSKDAKPGIESPLVELMRQIELDDRTIVRCLARYSTDLLQQWLDITLAARERHGSTFFRKSPAAYFINNVQNAAQGKRTPPDWWHDLVRDERRLQAESSRRKRSATPGTNGASGSTLVDAVTRQFRAAGQSDADAAANARRFVAACGEQPENPSTAAIIKILS